MKQSSSKRQILHPDIENSIYTPSKNPKEAFLLVTFISLVGILGTAAISNFFMIFATIFWMTYTGMLVYLQFKHKTVYPKKTLTEFLLNPQTRFFVFIFLGAIGLFGALKEQMWISYTVLIAWWIFSLNFYMYFKEWKNHDAV